MAVSSPPPGGPPARGAGTPDALAEPTVRVRPRWISSLAVAYLGLWMAWFGPLQVLLPEQMAEIAPQHKELALGWVTGVGAAAAMLVNPLVGALSDRTTGRFGRRRPWIVLGAVAGAVALALLGTQHTVAGVLIGWLVAQAMLAALQAGLSASVPDRVPVRQRGVVSGWVGIPQSLGVVVAVALVTMVVTGIAGGYLVIGAAVLIGAGPFVLLGHEARLPRTARPPLSPRGFVRGFWVSPRGHPDFAWAWLTRFLVQLGNAMATLYLLYFLRDQVGYERLFPGQDASEGLLILICVYTAAVVATTVVAGAISDRRGRRRSFVTVSGLISAVPALLLACWPTWYVTIVGAVLLGIGFGVFLAVDNALITQVLPTAAGRAKDLGIINIANSGPQVLGPAVAGPIVVYLGGYPVLYLISGALAVLGACLVWKIKSVA